VNLNPNLRVLPDITPTKLQSGKWGVRRINRPLPPVGIKVRVKRRDGKTMKKIITRHFPPFQVGEDTHYLGATDKDK